MATLTVVYWRDIPAQVIARQGRKSVKKMLSDRFQEAIDMAAMRSGAASTDDYLEDWRKGEPVAVEGNLEDAASALVEELETGWPEENLKALVSAGGRSDT